MVVTKGDTRSLDNGSYENNPKGPSIQEDLRVQTRVQGSGLRV